MGADGYTELMAWRKAIDLTSQIYEITSSFPSAENFGLTAQLRRAAVSIPSNIAEGQGRRSDRDFIRFLGIASGSVREVHTQLLIAGRLGYLGADRLRSTMTAVAEVGRLISGLSRSLCSRKGTRGGPIQVRPAQS